MLKSEICTLLVAPVPTMSISTMIVRSVSFLLFLCVGHCAHAQVPTMLPAVEQVSPDLLGSVPPNGLCSGAGIVQVPMNTPVTVTGNNQNAPTDPVFVANVVWEGFTTNGCSDLIVSYCGTTPNFQGGLVYLTTGCPLTNLVFNSAGNIIPNICGDGNFGVRFPGLPAGTYYYPVLEAPGSGGDYTLVFFAEPCSVAPPVNAVCTGAIPLTPATTCEFVTGTVENATAANVTGTACGNGNVADGVWYSFVATSSSVEVTVNPSPEFNVHLSLIAGECAGQTLLACAIGQNFGTPTTLSSSGLVVGNTYYLRVADWYAGAPRTSTFDLCVVAMATSACEAAAGNVIPDMANVCFAGPSTTITATPSGTSVVPPGYSTIFLLVSSTEVVLQMNDQPTFAALYVGGFSIRTLVYDPITYDPGTIALGQTTIGSLNEQFIQGGGSICAGLDITGAGFTVENCCPAAAGSLTVTSTPVCWEEPGVLVTAAVNGDQVVPAGFVSRYLLARDVTGVIVDTASSPSFLVDTTGTYTIHTVVYDTLTYSLDSLALDTTTISEVGAFFVAGGGARCGALDLLGVAIDVVRCCPGALGQVMVANDTLCFRNEGVTFSWELLNADVPEGYSVIYVLADLNGSVLDTTSTAAFLLDAIGGYAVHQLIYDSLTFDLVTAIDEGFTISGMDALLVQGGGAVCALLDTAGTAIAVSDCRPANDDCSTPQFITVQVVEGCAAGLVQGDNTYATQEDAAAPSCGDPVSTFADVWYVFNSGANTGITINFDPGTMTAWGIAVQDACDGTELLCVTQPGAPMDLDVQPGVQLLVRVFTDLALGDPGAFAMCVTGAVTSTICNGGLVATSDDAAFLAVCQDGSPDVVEFSTNSTSPVNYTYMVTDLDSIIVAVVSGNSIDFNEMMLGTYLVHGVSHDGEFNGSSAGEPLEGLAVNGQCLAFASNTVEVRVEICSGITEALGGAWSIWPNPNNGHFSISGPGVESPMNLQVLSLDGRLVYERSIAPLPHAALSVELPVNSGSGSYIVRVLSGSAVSTAWRMVVY